MISKRAQAAAAIMASLLLAGTAQAAVTLRITSSSDAAFEGPGGLLQSSYGLTTIAGGSYLPPLERAIGQIKQASFDRRGLFLPTAATGKPVADGGTGVIQALTNVSAYQVASTDFGNGVAEAFSITRIGNIVNMTFGSNSFTSDSRLSLGDINAFQLRIRSDAINPPSGNLSNSILLSNLIYNDSITINQSLADFSASNGAVSIGLWDGIVGDFSLAGQFTVSWAGTRPRGSALAMQIKLLEVPDLGANAVPEPGSWALLIAGFGLTGAALRRRRAMTA